MIAIVSLFVILVLSLVATRVATVALSLTGLSHELARFQARSAFTGCGYTTAESEQIVNHPVRRRIIMVLMLLGNAGIVTAVSSLVLAFVRTARQTDLWLRLAVVTVGVAALWALASSSWLTRWTERVIRWALRKWTSLEVRDYASLLRLSDDFAVSEISVEPEDWVVGKTLAELDLHAEGITVLGIQRDGGGYVAVPTGKSVIRAGDLLIVYGRADAIRNLDERRKGSSGDMDHRRAISDETRRLRQQEMDEQQRLASRPGAAG